MAVEETIKIEADVKDVVKKLGTLEKAMEEFSASQKKQSEQLEKSIEQSGKAAKEQAKQVSGVRKAIKKLGSGFKGLGLAMKAAGFGLVIKLVDSVTEKMKENQAIVNILSGASETFGIVLKQITDIFTPIIKQVVEATGGFDALQKVLGGALTISVNVVLGAIQGLILGVKAAQLAWEKSFFGGKDEDKIKQLQADIDATKDKLAQTGQNIANAGKQVGENFIEAVGEVGMGIEAIADGAAQAIEKVDIKAASQQGKALARQKKNFELQALQQQRLVEEYDRAAEELRQIRDDETLSIDERMKANEDLGKVLEEQNKAEKATVQARIDAIANEIKLKGKSTELSNELFSLETELAAVDAKVAGFKSEQLTNQNALIKEQNELKQSQLETDTTLNLEQARFLVEQETNEMTRLEMMRTVLEQEKEIELARLQMKIDTYQLGTQARIDAENEYKERKQSLDQEIASNENAINQLASQNEIKWAELTQAEKLNVISSGFKNLSAILGEESAAGKAAAIAAATIDTYNSATSSYKSLAGIPIIGPALGAAAAGAAIVSGIANVKKIASTKTPGGKSTAAPSISAPSSSGAATSAPPAFNVVGASGQNQLADAIAQTEKKPVKAFVTSNDVSTAQSLDRNIVEAASI